MLVPFGSNEKIGFVVDFATKTSLKTVKPILGLLDDQPAVTSGQMELAVWMAAYYATPLGPVSYTHLTLPTNREV